MSEQPKTYRLCQKLIWTSRSSNTYCMLEEGHEGKCAEARKLPEIKEEKKNPSREEVLEKYGPFKPDDPRAKRGY